MLLLGFSVPLQNTLSAFKYKPLSSSSSFTSINVDGYPIRRMNNSNYTTSLVSISKSRRSTTVSSSSSSSSSCGGGGEGGEEEERERQYLPAGLRADLMPEHVAVIMDGNRRWAAERDLAPVFGHYAGRRALRDLVRLCCKLQLKVLTVFAFSTENWSRPKEEVDHLMALFENVLKVDLKEFTSRGVRQTVIGNRSMLSKSLQETIACVEETSKANSRIQVNIAINYSGRYDVIQACKSIANKVKNGLLQPADINENLIVGELETKYIESPYPDLLIRTSGEHRTSNFMLWQLAYSELFFAKKLFPDFREADFIEALCLFQEKKIML